jgi:adenylate kinase
MIPHIPTGDIFRSNIKEGTALGVQVKDYIQKGKLVPDNLTISLVEDRLRKEDCKNKFLLDGFPRNINQAKELDLILSGKKQYIDKVFLIDVPKHIILERIAGRRFCIKCGSSYHIKFNPSKADDKCQFCGHDLIQRPDDKEEVVIDRISIYNKTTKPLVDYYSAFGILYKIQGDDNINNIFNSISGFLQST